MPDDLQVVARLVHEATGQPVLVSTGGRPGPAASEALAAGLTAQDAELLAEVPGDGDPVAVAEQVVGAGPDAVVLATPDGGEATVALIAALGAAGFGGERLWLVSPNVENTSPLQMFSLLNVIDMSISPFGG
jgi:hypothetical protein